jgi:pilus assembly protein CpaE
MEQLGQRPIRVAIIDDIQETRDNLAKLLLFENDIQVVGNTGSGKEAIELARKLRPDIMLMDINMPDMDGIAATERICSEVIGTSVIMMSVLGDHEHMRRSMLAGAREFLTKPFGSEELVSAIRHVYQLDAGKRVFGATASSSSGALESERPPGRIISSFSPKGGVGCTTIITNLAVALKEITGKEVALVDCSLLFGDVGVMLNLISNKTISDLASRTDQIDDDLINEVMVCHPSGVKVLLSPPRPQMAELIAPEQVRAILLALQKRFDYVLVDTWPSFHENVLSVLDLSELILLVMTLEMPAIKDVRLFLEVAELLNYSSDKLMLILNRASAKAGISAEDVETSIRHKVAVQIVSDWRTVGLAMNQGIPLVTNAKGSQVAKSIASIAELIRNQKLAVEAAAEKAERTEAKGLGRLRTALHFAGR